MLRIIFMTFAVPILPLLAAQAAADDWPQILGLNRDGRAAGELLSTDWPESGPKLVWQCDLGRGFAGPAVAEGFVYLFHRVKDKEIAESRDAASGELAWRVSFPATYQGQIFPEQDGPLCTPMVADGKVYFYGAAGDLYCLDAKTGQQRWTKRLYETFRARFGLIDYGYFGAGGGPILADGKVFVNVGGHDNAGIVALDAKTGEVVWKGTTEDASYSAPTLATVDGVQHLIFVTRYNCISLDPRTYEVHFRFPFGKRGPTVNGATPLVIHDTLFVSASYGVGCVATKISDKEAQPIWANDSTMSSQYSTCVAREGYLYGIDGRSDVGIARLRCVRLTDGKVMWTEADFGIGSLTLADNQLLILKEDGQLCLVEPSPNGYKLNAKFKAFESTARALPALSAGRLYARDEDSLKCFDLSADGKIGD